MQAIQTRYIGPSNSRGARIRAYSEGFPRGIIVSWDYSLDVEENHHRAAKALAEKLEWRGEWRMGGAADGRGNVYVCGGPIFEVRSGLARE